jgi:hypothetical protein
MAGAIDPRLSSLPAVVIGVVAALGCAAEGDSSGAPRVQAPNSFDNIAGSSGASGGAGGVVPGGTLGGSGGPGPTTDWGAMSDGGQTQACASARAATDLQPVHLAFAFDVSGSMGKGDEPWHDKALKWDPVVLATRAFFADAASAGLLASLTFFPEDGDDDERCVEDAYEEPDVEMTELPSEAFAEAIEAIEPESEDDWRGGTPTVFVMRGTAAFVEQYRQDQPGRYAIVLVTDGYPQGCEDDEDTIEAVVSVIEDARDDDVATYVIGVANPPIDDAPDTVSDLHALAEAGGSEQAYLIDTGDPEATADAFTQAIAAVRETAITCSLAIPDPPDGETFDKERVAVHFSVDGGAEQNVDYDAQCSDGAGWHYDDAAAPSEIVLCESTCEDVQGDARAEFEIELACEQLIDVE